MFCIKKWWITPHAFFHLIPFYLMTLDHVIFFFDRTTNITILWSISDSEFIIFFFFLDSILLIRYKYIFFIPVNLKKKNWKLYLMIFDVSYSGWSRHNRNGLLSAIHIWRYSSIFIFEKSSTSFVLDKLRLQDTADNWQRR